MIKKIFKWGVIGSFVFLILIIGTYIYSPQIVVKGVSKTVTTVIGVLGETQTFSNEYGIHPYLLKKVNLVLKEAKSKGIDLRVTAGNRSIATQEKYYNQGRTTKGAIITNAPPGLSYHNYGWAVDVVEYTNGKPNWKSKRWNEIGAIGKKHGLVWGGDWTRFVDKPHMQLSFGDILTHCLF